MQKNGDYRAYFTYLSKYNYSLVIYCFRSALGLGLSLVERPQSGLFSDPIWGACARRVVLDVGGLIYDQT